MCLSMNPAVVIASSLTSVHYTINKGGERHITITVIVLINYINGCVAAVSLYVILY